MLTRIDAPFADARAGDLSLAFDRPPEPALCTMRLDRVGFELELRILGWSHQVLARRGRHTVSETVACLPGADPGLPGEVARLGPAGLFYRFRSSSAGDLEINGDDRFDRRAERILGEVGSDENGLVGVFPGPEHAFTALRVTVEEATVVWESWHSYPQTREIVATGGRLCVR